ncbi:MAG: adenosylmethionine--8-amino-7-oxononanoate transaminase [Streptosporangiales bacterium]|nr:adenosylmethionine--8-amino-7-oxononanoate transaminase [Streptosporangiales bacterium]
MEHELDVAKLLAYDRDHLWHPYSDMLDPAPVQPVVGAEGVRLELADGRRLVDGMSSWWAAIHGYRHPRLDAAVRDQLDRMAHVMFGGLTHPPAVRLARHLVDLTPAPLTQVFLADSGSVSVEVAIKMALQYHLAGDRPGRDRLLTVRGGYHGDTFGDMAVCDPVNGMHHLFQHVLPEHVFAPEPPQGFDAPLDTDYLALVERALAEEPDRIAAVIVEPVVQGAGGMRVYSPGYLKALRDLCDAYGALLILDEIATGFGRTGTMFAAEHAGISPDIMCVGKALTGGYMTMAATLCTRRVAEGIGRGSGGALMHGPTFMANPLAAAVACASIELLLESPWQERVAVIETRLRQGLAAAASLPRVADVRVLGAIGVIELAEPVDMPAVTKVVMDHGVWLRPFRNLIYTMPPYTVTAEEVDMITTAMLAAAQA